ncbi:hypothetical protein PV325_001271 [Microctonus aethiopoides]|nr:hypothetical protein PV325_001271 [Microctonus aethiopoides]
MADASNKRKMDVNNEDIHSRKIIKQQIKEMGKYYNTNNLERIFNIGRKNQVKPNLNVQRRNSTSGISDAGSLGSNSNSQDIDAWEIPNPKKTSRTQPSDENSQPMEISNRYDSLNNLNEQATTSTGPNTNQNSYTRASGQNKQTRPPPIHIKNSNIRQILNKMKSNNINKTDYYIKQIDETTINVYTTKIETHMEIKNNLKKEGIEFFTYTRREDKPKTYVLKGIRGNFEENEVLEDIKNNATDNLNVTKVMKCVKCAETHEPGKCEIQMSEDSSKLKCANCNNYGHPTSYKGCPFASWAIKLKKEAKKIRKAEKNAKKRQNFPKSKRKLVIR